MVTHVTGAAEVIAADRPGCFVVRLDGRDQFYVDLDDPTHLAFDYVRRMADVVDACAAPGVPLRVVHVGGGGLTLARYVAATRPTSAQVVLEPDAALTELVRAELPLPRRSGIKVRAMAGAEGVGALRDDAADVLLLDAFADGVVPADLVTVEHLTDVARVLGDGAWVANVVDRPPWAHARRVLAGVRTAFEHVVVGVETATWNGRREGNLVAVASRSALPDDVPRAARDYRVLVGRQVSDALGGGTPYRDADLPSKP